VEASRWDCLSLGVEREVGIRKQGIGMGDMSIHKHAMKSPYDDLI